MRGNLVLGGAAQWIVLAAAVASRQPATVEVGAGVGESSSKVQVSLLTEYDLAEWKPG
jgi:hypothetical protein